MGEEKIIEEIMSIYYQLNDVHREALRGLVADLIRKQRNQEPSPGSRE